MGLFEMTDHALDGLDAKRLTTQTDRAMIGLIASLLEDNGIPHMLRQGSAESDRRVVGDYGTTVTAIYVHEDDYARARELLDAYVDGGAEPVADQE